MFCPKCGNQLEENAKFCAKCGYSVNQFQASASNTGVPVHTSEVPVHKEKKKKKRFMRLVIGVIALIAILMGGAYVFETTEDTKYIDFVKNGTPESYPETTYGEAFEAFFQNPSWEYFEAEDGSDVVEFTGDCLYEDTEVTAMIQFILDYDKGTFETGAFSMNDVPQNQLMTAVIISTVFDDYEDGKDKDSLNTIPDDKDLATEDSGDASMETEKPEKTDVSEDISANTAQEEAPIQALNLSDYLDNPYMSIYWDQLDMLDRSSGVVWYSVYDMDADGIPELFVSVGESYNQKGELYTIKGENATYLGSFDGNTVLYVDPEDGKVVAVYGYMGTEVLTYLTKSPAGLTIAKQPYRELEPDEDYYETPYPIECNWTADDEAD